jgi:LmbE family N-acetylglucosaminyl deacetylase
VSRRFAAVVAHPDDDTFGVSGTVARHADDPEFVFTLVHVTSGDKGQIADPSLATPATLGAVREREDISSWRALGREPDRHEFLRYPDGGVASADFEGLVGAIEAVLRAARPDVVVTFGPEGVTGHTDHITTGLAATEAFHRVRTDAGNGMRRLLHNELPAAELQRFSDELVKRGLPAIDPTQPFQPRGVPDETIGVVVDCLEVVPRKAAALREHRTQADDANFPEDLIEGVLRYETFVVAWPPREAGAPVLTDVFDGLD